MKETSVPIPRGAGVLKAEVHITTIRQDGLAGKMNILVVPIYESPIGMPRPLTEARVLHLVLRLTPAEQGPPE